MVAFLLFLLKIFLELDFIDMAAFLKQKESEFLRFCEDKEYDFLAFSEPKEGEKHIVAAFISAKDIDKNDFESCVCAGGYNRYYVKWKRG